MWELWRRAGLLIGIPAALVMFAWPASDLVSVAMIDWNSSDSVSYSQRSAYRAALRALAASPSVGSSEEAAAKEVISQAIEAETAGRLWRGERAGWAAVADALAAAGRSLPADSSWEARRGVSGSAKEFYFRRWEPPVNEIPAEVLERRGLVYVLVEEGVPPRHLRVMPVSATGVAYSAPRPLAHPHRHAAFWLGLAILAPYVLIPWPKPPETGIVYATRAQTFAADVVGTILYATFIGMWAMLLHSPSGPANDFSGALIITIVFWGFGLAGVVVYGVAIWFACKRLELVGEELVYRTWHGVERYRVRDLAGIDCYVQPQPVFKGFKIFGALVSLLNWRALGPTLLLRTEEERLRFRLADGGEISFGSLPLAEAVRLIGALRALGVCVDDSVYERYGCAPTDAAFAGATPGAGTLAWMYVVVGLVAAGLLYGAVETVHPPLPTIGGSGAEPVESSGGVP